MTEEATVQDKPKKKMGTGAKIGLGCGIGCLSIVLIIAAVIFGGYRYVMGKVDKWSAEFDDKGFAKAQVSQVVEISDPVTEKQYYTGQVVKITSDAETDVGIIAQIGEVHGTVRGTLYFRGQALVIQPSAVIEGDVDVIAQAVQIFGTVNGEIKGSYQQLDDKRER